MASSPLENLLIDDTALQDEILADLLRDRIQLTVSGGIVFKADASRLGVRSRVLIGLLGGAALHRLGKRREQTITPKELEVLIGVPGGTLRPALRDLVSRKLVRADRGRYEIPAYAINEVREALQ